MIKDIVDEAIEKGFITIYANTDPEVTGQIQAYNIAAGGCRRKMKRAKYIQWYALACHAFMVIVLWVRFDPEGTSFDRPNLVIPFSIINAVTLIAYLFLKQKHLSVIMCMTSAALLPLIYRGLYFPLVVHVGAFAISQYIQRPLKNRKGYPHFNNIYISYVRINSPT